MDNEENIVTGCDKQYLCGQRENRIAMCSWLFPLLKLSWLIPKTWREGEGDKAIWAAIALLLCHGACEHLNPRKWLWSPSKAVQMLLLWEQYRADPLEIFFIYSLQAKTLRSPTLKHYSCYSSPSHIAHPFSAWTGESRRAATQSTLEIKQRRPQPRSLKDTF